MLLTPAYRRAWFRHGVAASTEHDPMLRKLVPEGIKCVIDVGANRGQFALAARRHFPNAKIHCFEPLAEPAAIFSRLFQHDPGVILDITAIGAAAQQSAIHVSFEDDSSSLLPISALQTSMFPGTAEKETRVVSVLPLDALVRAAELETPAFLKIDVQGFEADVLKGCGALLPLFTYIYVECSFMPLYSGQALAGEIVHTLDGYGFSVTGIYNLCFDRFGSPVQGDFLFARKSSKG